MYMVLLSKGVPRAARFYAHGSGLGLSLCTKRWADLLFGPFKIAPYNYYCYCEASNIVCYSSMPQLREFRLGFVLYFSLRCHVFQMHRFGSF